MRKLLSLPRLKSRSKTKTTRLQHVFVFIPANAEPRLVAESSFPGLWRREDRACKTEADVHKLAQKLYDRYVWEDAPQTIQLKINECFPNGTGQFGVDRYVPVFITLGENQQLERSHELRSLTENAVGKTIANTLVTDDSCPAAVLARRLAAE